LRMLSFHCQKQVSHMNLHMMRRVVCAPAPLALVLVRVFHVLVRVLEEV